MVEKIKAVTDKLKRRTLGEHLTSEGLFIEYILPEIKNKLYNHIWTDLYAGRGNLILPILNEIKYEEREEFFKNHIYLFDIQNQMVEDCIENANIYGIPKEIAKKNIIQRDNLQNFPRFLKKKKYPIFHITNPPYLYLGYIRKHEETKRHFKYFESENKGYQDLYQIAMMNDLRNDIDDMVYIIPSNFLFGASVSNKIRLDYLKYYKILKMDIFETKVFEFTGTNICIGYFKRKNQPKAEPSQFSALKIKKQDVLINKDYILNPKYKYRAGSDFDEFLEKYRAHNPLSVKYYLMSEEVKNNSGSYQISAINANKYENNEYKRLNLKVNDVLKEKIESNILYVQTVDKGSIEGRVGLGIIKEYFNVDAIYVSGNTYRTHPIHIFLDPWISIEDQYLLKDYFKYILEYFREQLDSEFLTTYKYSNAAYTRKYLGLTQVRGLIETFPVTKMEKQSNDELIIAIKERNFKTILKILK